MPNRCHPLEQTKVGAPGHLSNHVDSGFARFGCHLRYLPIPSFISRETLGLAPFGSAKNALPAGYTNTRTDASSSISNRTGSSVRAPASAGIILPPPGRSAAQTEGPHREAHSVLPIGDRHAPRRSNG